MDQPDITIYTQQRLIELLEKHQRENKMECDIHILGLTNNLNLLRAAEIKHGEKIDKLQKKWNRQFQSATKFATSLRAEQLKGDRELEAEINEIRKTVQALNGGGKTKKRRKRRKKRRTRKPKKKRRKTKRRTRRKRTRKR